MKKRLSLSLAISIILAVTLLPVSLGAGAAEPACCDPTPATPIPQGLLYPLVPACQKYIRDWDRFPEGYSNPVDHLPIPEHPYMAPNGMSNMHNDPYMTDTYEISGPLGLNPQVNSTYYGLAECVTVTFDSQGRIVTVLGGFGAPTLLLLDPVTLDELARYVLPSRPWYWIFDEIGILEDPSGGAYFYLDHEGNVVVTTHDYRILVVSVPNNPCDGFQVVREYDLSDHVLPQPWPNRDKVGPAIPDWGEEREFYWYTTRYGMVGTVEVGNPTNIHTVPLAGEQIQNSPAVGEDGFYVITDHAMYRFTTDENGNITQKWRTEYDRGTRKKPGMITQGSGTTPNLFGDLVAIADNADPKMNVEFLRRSDGTRVCAPISVFGDDKSCTENALIGVARSVGDNTIYSVIVENNYGYETFFTPIFGKSTVGGVTRIDVTLDSDGNCIDSGKKWTSDEISCTPVPKMSLANGLVYLYTKPHTCLIDKWYFTAVDFATGETVYKVLTGTGLGYNNNWAPITLGPGGGTAYVGTLAGMISVRDT